MTTKTASPGARAAAARRGLTLQAYLAIKDAGFKWCRSCQDWRPLTDYKPSTSTTDGVRPLCTRHYSHKDPTPIPHGRLVGYRRGCRCPECRETARLYQKKRNAERAADPAAADRAGHGKTSTYVNYGCRCAPCKAAQSASNRKYAQLRKQRQETSR
ncbi:hypothetical protein [Streptomyces sp. NPDC003395]